MPDFGLSDEEAQGIADYLMQGAGPRPPPAPGFQGRQLSRFSLNKARRLMAEKLPCLGCHRLGDDGGRIGPDLSQVKQRLQPAYVYQIIRDPSAVDAHAGMPKINLPEKTLDLVVNFLLQQEIPSEGAVYLSLVDNRLPQPESGGTPGALLYGRYCAPCHGIDGDGEGFNAGYLPVMPTRFADASYLSTRPDDTLFDGVYAGGYILNRHHRMPAWGQTLSTDAIRSLVAHMRELCQCAGPYWSRHD
jgi:mono/diheme cytochrome c family protein